MDAAQGTVHLASISSPVHWTQCLPASAPILPLHSAPWGSWAPEHDGISGHFPVLCLDLRTPRQKAAVLVFSSGHSPPGNSFGPC